MIERLFPAMTEIARGILMVIGALILMGVIASVVFILARSNPGLHIGWFFAAGGVLYTMIILFVLQR